MSNNTQVEMAVIPKCDICRTQNAKYDAMTSRGPWAYMCSSCFSDYGVGLGLGKGQELILCK